MLTHQNASQHNTATAGLNNDSGLQNEQAKLMSKSWCFTISRTLFKRETALALICGNQNQILIFINGRSDFIISLACSFRKHESSFKPAVRNDV